MLKFPRGLTQYMLCTSQQQYVGAGEGARHVKPLVTKREITVFIAPEQQWVYEQTLNSLIPSSPQS